MEQEVESDNFKPQETKSLSKLQQRSYHFRYSVVVIAFGKTFALFGEQGWSGGESTRLPPMWRGFDSRTRRHMWVEFVVGSRPCSEGFSPSTTVYHTPQKPTLPNPNSTLGGHPN